MHPSVLAVTGPHATQEVMDAVHQHVPKPHDPFIDLVPEARGVAGIKLTPKHFAYLKISEGCNHRCSFCIIPSMRGESRRRGEPRAEAAEGDGVLLHHMRTQRTDHALHLLDHEYDEAISAICSDTIEQHT